MVKKFFSKLADSMNNSKGGLPIMVLASLVLFLFTLLISDVSAIVKNNIHTTSSSFILLGVVTLILLTAGAFTLSGMIGVSAAKISENKIRAFWEAVRSCWIKNMALVALVLATGAAVTYISIQAPRIIVSFAGMNWAIALLLLIKIAGLLGLLSFLSLSNFVQVIERKSILHSIKESVRLVKKNYLRVSWPLLVFYIIFELPSFFIVQNKYLIVNDIVFAMIVFPAFVWIYTSITRVSLEQDDI